MTSLKEKVFKGLSAASPQNQSGKDRWLSIAFWALAALMVILLAAVIIFKPEPFFSDTASLPQGAVQAGGETAVSLPSFDSPNYITSLIRASDGHTTISVDPNQSATSYTVQAGDSIFAIAKQFNIKPESVLWANYDQLKDDPQTISVGMTLKIPPVDGVYYEWQEGDTLDAVASKYQTNADAILNWFGNRLDIADPKIDPGTYVMIPGGKGEFRQWVVPTFYRKNAGVNKSFPGACEVSDGAYGSGFFVWPADNHYLSGNDFWDGHLGIDIAAGMGANIYATDSGVVVYAGGIGGGYGNVIVIDHGNGYQSVYAHLSSVGVSCGSSVYSGQIIGRAGSTGNSTGPHLHFEIRFNGAFINPWQVLP